MALVALLALQSVAQAQLPGVDFTGSISAGVGAPVPCESCNDVAIMRTVGIQVRDLVGIGYRGVRWGDQGINSTSRMSTDLVTLDLHWPTPGRLRPFGSAGFGYSSAGVVTSSGAHAYTYFGPASSLPTTFWGIGLDIRLFRHVALTPMISSTSTRGAESKGQYCAQVSIEWADYRPSCSEWSSQRYGLRGFSIGIGIR